MIRPYAISIQRHARHVRDEYGRFLAWMDLTFRRLKHDVGIERDRSGFQPLGVRMD